MLQSAEQTKKIDINYYELIISNVGWFLLFCKIYKTKIGRPSPQR